MSASTYVALVRGINVGGRNLVSMADLRTTFERAGHRAVATYIQSGNVMFTSDAPRSSIEHELESTLERGLGLSVTVVVRSHRQLRAVVAGAPHGFGADLDTYLDDVVFLKAPLTARRALSVVELREGVDRVWPGSGVLYFSRRAARRVQSRLSRLASTPEYRQMTIRNWRTTTKLLALLDERGPA